VVRRMVRKTIKRVTTMGHRRHFLEGAFVSLYYKLDPDAWSSSDKGCIWFGHSAI